MELKKFLMYEFLWLLLFLTGALMGLDITGVFFPGQAVPKIIGILTGGSIVVIIINIIGYTESRKGEK